MSGKVLYLLVGCRCRGVDWLLPTTLVPTSIHGIHGKVFSVLTFRDLKLGGSVFVSQSFSSATKLGR